MQDIAIGDQVLARLDDGSLGYSRVIAHAQREPQAQINAIQITTEREFPVKERCNLRLTATHNVFTRRLGGGEKFQARFAEHVEIGDEVLVLDDKENILFPANVIDIKHEDMTGG